MGEVRYFKISMARNGVIYLREVRPKIFYSVSKRFNTAV